MEDPKCTKYYETFPDYLYGGHHIVYYKISDVREYTNMCGKNAKDFEQKEVQVKERPKDSWWKLIQDFFNTPYMLR
jgi:hypothetical protein